jgi:hypothetical protein
MQRNHEAGRFSGQLWAPVVAAPVIRMDPEVPHPHDSRAGDSPARPLGWPHEILDYADPFLGCPNRTPVLNQWRGREQKYPPPSATLQRQYKTNRFHCWLVLHSPHGELSLATAIPGLDVGGEPGCPARYRLIARRLRTFPKSPLGILRRLEPLVTRCSARKPSSPPPVDVKHVKHVQTRSVQPARGRIVLIRFCNLQPRSLAEKTRNFAECISVETEGDRARDWAQFLDAAEGWYATHRCRGEP